MYYRIGARALLRKDIGGKIQIALVLNRLSFVILLFDRRVGMFLLGIFPISSASH